MPTFTWQAKTRGGETRTGEMQADNADAVHERLRTQNLVVEKVKKKSEPIVLKLPGQTGVSTRDLVIFTRQFATMIDAGLPLIQCLDLLSSQLENVDFKKILVDVKATVESGATLADALGKHPKVFDRLFVNLVAAGEAGGVLDTILARLAGYMEKSMKLKKEVKSALTYPIMVCIGAGIVTLILLIFVIPIFQDMFRDMGSALPAPTQFVVDLSDWTRGNIHFVIAGIIGSVVGFKRALGTKRGRRMWDAFTLMIPVFGPMLKKMTVAKFTRTLGTMLSSGVNILDALEIVSVTAGNLVVEEGLAEVRRQISEGKTIAEPLAQMPVFPSMVVQMIAVGESTGAMDTMLNKIADFYDDEVDAAVATMMAMLEPIIMAGLAVVLGGLVIAMYLPVFTMAGGA
jgi:type IV pilus assembly protein PilC